MSDKLANGWYWVLVRGFRSATYTWHSEWVCMEYDGWWKWDYDMLRRKGLNDMTTVVRTVGPLEKPEPVE